MLRAHCATLALVPLMLIVYPACTGEKTSDDWIATAEAEDAVRSTAPMIGTFRDEYAAGGVAVLTLKTDWGFHMEEAVVCVRYPCELPQFNGRYAYGQRGAMSTLILMDETGSEVNELAFILKGDDLYLAPDASGSSWQVLRRSERSWCGEPTDCVLQRLRAGRCRGEWTCEAHECNFQCGAIVPEPTTGSECTTDGCITDPSASLSEAAE